VSDDLVKAEVRAARALKQGVGRYAEQIRGAAAQARREIAAADRKAQEALERRRSEVRKREQELRQAQAALRQCRQDCGGLRRQAEAAAQRLADASQALGRARKAAQLTATAQSDLLKTLQNIEAAVGEHSSVASSALASLDSKLASLPHFDLGSAAHDLLAGTAVTVEVLAAVSSFGRLAGDAAQAVNVNFPIRDHSVAEMAEHQRDQEADYVIKKDAEDQERMNSGERRETTA